MNQLFPPPIKRNLDEQNEFRLKSFYYLLILFLVAAVAILPHARAMKVLAYQAGETKDLILNPIWQAIGNTLGFSFLLGAVFIYMGLWMSARANLGAPLIARWLSGVSLRKLTHRKVVMASILLGMSVAALSLLQLKIQETFLPLGIARFEHPSALPSLFAAFSAGVTEEVMFRLGFMSLVVTLLQIVNKSKTPSNATIWSGNLITAFLFGLTHLPMASNYYELTPVVIGTIVMGNVITGLTFGWVFWRYGLIMAMLAHFSFVFVFHVIGSPFG